MSKLIKKCITENIYLLLGIIIGLYISSFISDGLDISCTTTDNPLRVDKRLAQEIINSSINRLAPKILPEKSKGEEKSTFVRPRYYSTELGIREKLFVGIFTSEDKVNSHAVHINKTIGHIVDKIKFFITAQYKLKTKFNLTGLVGFTDARSKYRPFQVIKYVADTFSMDYDYYFFANDNTFINVHRLQDVVNKISVSMDVYLGTKVRDSSYCNLDAGIIISNSVLRAARKDLEWCIMNAVSDDQSENIGRCIHHSLDLSCQEAVQGQAIPSFKLKHFNLNTLKSLSKSTDFNAAVTVRPVITNDDFFRLNAYYLKQRLEMHNKQISEISQSLTDSWPPGQRPGAVAATRFDMQRQHYFNMTHIFLPDDFTILRRHTESELTDIQNILTDVTSQVDARYPKEYEFRRLVNGYKTFDLSRGLDYTLDLGFRDLHSGKEIVKRLFVAPDSVDNLNKYSRRFEVCKPLGNVELIPVPYVTENVRVSVILPVEESDVFQAMHFLDIFDASIMGKKEKTLLLLVLLYQYNSESKGPNDVFAKQKRFVKQAAAKYENEDIRVSWLSIRLPQTKKPLLMENSRVLNFAVVDLALKKIGLHSLTLVLDVWASVTVDFLNRVRMNTIEDYQIYCPIPFRQYSPFVTQLTHLEVNKMSGHFDREEFRYISFYGSDYVRARKQTENIIPLIRTDNDITKLLKLKSEFKEKGNIFEVFLQFGGQVHCMRATEMNLKILYHFEKDRNRMNKFYGNDAQLAKLLLTKEDIIPELM